MHDNDEHPNIGTLIWIEDYSTAPRVLVGRRSDAARRHPHALTLPGGWLRLNETAEAGALRELREETGVDAIADRVRLQIDPLRLQAALYDERNVRCPVATLLFHTRMSCYDFTTRTFSGDGFDPGAWRSIPVEDVFAMSGARLITPEFRAAIEVMRARRKVHW